MHRLDPWHGTCNLQFFAGSSGSQHQGGCTAPLKLMRAERGENGRCELPLLHTAGGLVGGDQLSVNLGLRPGSRCLLTSVAAQKVYGSVGRSQLHPQGAWARQQVLAELEAETDLEWLPQELVLYADALFEQSLSVTLPMDGSFLSAEIVRLGRTAANETLGRGCWRSSLQIQRQTAEGRRWELVDRLEISDAALKGVHGLNQQPVFGTLVWAAPFPLPTDKLNTLLDDIRQDRNELKGTMQCGVLPQGLIARYSGFSSRDARFWFSRIWARTRQARALAAPQIPRVWPLQEDPLKA
ncbi:MAG: urease accessory protein UreD [Synechococcus sp.]